MPVRFELSIDYGNICGMSQLFHGLVPHTTDCRTSYFRDSDAEIALHVVAGSQYPMQSLSVDSFWTEYRGPFEHVCKALIIGTHCLFFPSLHIHVQHI